MLVVGHTTSSDLTAANATADRVYSSLFTVASPCLLAKLSAYVDGDGTANLAQTVKAVVYDENEALVGSSPETTITPGQDVAWLDFVFDTPLELTEQDYHFGLHFGTNSTGARLYKSSTGTNFSTTTDTYSDGPATTLSVSAASGELGIFGTYFAAWTQPDEDDEYLANLAFPTAQTVFGTTAPDPRTKKTVLASWHGTFLDPQPQGASVVVVQTGGDLTDYVGERVRIISGGKSVVAYVHRETDLDLDDSTQISLSRRLWQELAPLATDSLLVSVEVLQPEGD
jgi:hypothetical protein